MKKLLLILLCLPMIGFGQLTYVPDDNFEAYLEANGMGNGIANDDSVTTADISSVTHLWIYNESISDLTGIEDFASLIHLECWGNQLATLDLSNNTNLIELRCANNQLTILDLSQNSFLIELWCMSNQLTSIDITSNVALVFLRLDYNQLTSLDLSNNTNLEYLDFFDNQLTAIDLSNNTNLIELRCGYNQLDNLDITQNPNLEYLICPNNLIDNIDISQNFNLIVLVMPDNNLAYIDCSNNINLLEIYLENNLLNTLDVRNGNNLSITNFWSYGNPHLYCISVDDVAWSYVNWTGIDPQHSFSNNCSGTSVEEHTTNKDLLKITDLLGRETKQTNQPLLYLYDDGTAEKRIVIE